MTSTTMQPIATSPRPPAGDTAEGVPSVIRVTYGGPDAWLALHVSIASQLLDAGASGGEIDQICKALKKIYLKWSPGTAILVNEEDRNTALPLIEELAHLARVTVNGLLYELLQREIEISRRQAAETA